MYGSKKKSYQDLNGARMVVKHARTVDEEKRGARSRNISAVYIENKDGERFKFPNTYLPAARAMTRHISNEGYPNDERGKHILDIMAEMMDLRKFSRRTKRQEYTEEAREIIGDATDRYYGLKDTLESMKKQTGYEQYFENWSPDQIEVDENDLEDLKIKLTREMFDDELSDTLTNVGKAVAMGKIKREEEENRMGSEAANLKTFAASSDPIMMHPNTEGDAELRNYQMFIKNSNMPVEKRNLAMVQRIMMELSNRMVDDALASAIGRLDMDNSSDAATAFAMAKKYLKGETQTQMPKAKKDLFGKDKPVESWDDFERAVESTVDESVVQEGTWSLPENEAEAMKLAAMMGEPIALGDGGNNAADALGGLIGDDELFDDLGVAGDKDPEGDARGIIIGWMMEHVDDYGATYKETMQMALDKIRADGNDSGITIPRTFGAQQDRAYNTSSTQGERMGSNADDMKEDTVSEDREVMVKVTNIEYDGPTLDKLPTDKTVKVMVPAGADDEEVYDMVADKLEDQHGTKVSGFDMKFGESIEESMCSLKCKYCSDMLGHPTTDCEYDSMDPKGDNWYMVDIDRDGDADVAISKTSMRHDHGHHAAMHDDVQEGKMSDLHQHIGEMIADGASNEEIKKMHPMVKDSDIDSIRREMDESVVQTDEASDMIAKMKAMAGVGSNVKSNHGIREGEAGYQITPRSIVAREMRKLQDIANK